MHSSKPKTVALIGAPWCEGQNLEGADLAPVAMREAGLSSAVKSLGLGFFDLGDIDFSHVTPKSPHHYSVDVYREWLKSGTSLNFSTWMKEGHRAKEDQRGSKRMRSPESVQHPCETTASTGINVVNAELMGCGLKLVYDQVKAALRPERSREAFPVPSWPPTPPFVLTVGGDHSIASGSISAVLERYPSCGVIWVDAHADANTPRSSPSGHYHGMPAAHLLGWFDKPGEMGGDKRAGAAPTALRGFEWFRSGCLSESKLAYIG